MTGLVFFLIGAVALAAGWVALREAEPPPLSVRLATGVAIALLTLIQVIGASEEFDRYRITLLGTRIEVADRDGRPLPVRLRLDGDRDSADVFIPSAPPRIVAWLAPFADTSGALAGVYGRQPEDSDVFLLHRRGRGDWRPLRAVPLEPGDTLLVRTPLGARRLVTRTFRDRRWRVGHRVVDVASGATAELPIREHALRPVFTGRDLWRQTHPLADVLRVLDNAGEDPPVHLTSVLYHDGDDLFLLDLDSEVEVLRRPRISRPDSTVWLDDGAAHSLRVAAVPRRDVHDPHLVPPPQRGGVRVLYTARLSVPGRWIEVTPERPEVHALGRTELDRIAGRAPLSAHGSGWRVRLTGDPESPVPNAVALSGLPRRLAPAADAYLELPDAVGPDRFAIRTPTGLHTWELGRPLPLGRTSRAQAVIRVDRQAVAAGFVGVLLLALLIPVAALTLPAPPSVWALAVAVFGLGCVRMLASLSIFLEFPFRDDAYASALWVPAVITSGVVLLGGAGARLRGGAGKDGADRTSEAEPVWPGLAIGLAAVVLVELVSERRVAPVLPLLIVAAYAVSLVPVGRWLLRWVGGLGLTAVAGAILTLLLLRVLAFLAGMREQLPLGDRFAISIIYTPAALLLWIALVERLNRLTLADLPDRAARGRATALWTAWRARWRRLDLPPRALVELVKGLAAGTLRRRWERGGATVHARLVLAGTALYLTAVFFGIGVLVSDHGLALLGVAGIAVFLLALAWRLPGSEKRDARMAAALVIPVFVFLFVQLRPDALLLTRAGTASSAEALRFREWDADALRLLDRASPEAVERIGHTRSEALVIMRRTMEAYTRRGGEGFLNGDVTRSIAATAPREHAPSAVIAGQWGVLGSLSVIALLVALMLPAAGGMAHPGGLEGGPARVMAGAGALLVLALLLPRPWGPLCGWGTAASLLYFAWPRTRDMLSTSPGEHPLPLPETLAGAVAAVVLLTMGIAGIYMIAANHGVGLFTGKNVYLLGLDSDSDVVESLGLLSIAALALGLRGCGAATPAGGTDEWGYAWHGRRAG